MNKKAVLFIGLTVLAGGLLARVPLMFAETSAQDWIRRVSNATPYIVNGKPAQVVSAVVPQTVQVDFVKHTSLTVSPSVIGLQQRVAAPVPKRTIPYHSIDSSYNARAYLSQSGRLQLAHNVQTGVRNQYMSHTTTVSPQQLIKNKNQQ